MFDGKSPTKRHPGTDVFPAPKVCYCTIGVPTWRACTSLWNGPCTGIASTFGRCLFSTWTVSELVKLEMLESFLFGFSSWNLELEFEDFPVFLHFLDKTHRCTFLFFLHPPRKHLIKCFKDITLRCPSPKKCCLPSANGIKNDEDFPIVTETKGAMVINPPGIPQDPHVLFFWNSPVGMDEESDDQDSHFILPKKIWRWIGHVQNLHEIGNMIETPCSNHWKSNEFYLLQDSTNHWSFAHDILLQGGAPQL